MVKAITFDVKGIKCDSPTCDYKDMTVDFDMEKYHNAPCPKCGANLFTDKDYNNMKAMIKAANFINKFSWLFKKSKTKRYAVKMDGSGDVTVALARDDADSQKCG